MTPRASHLSAPRATAFWCTLLAVGCGTSLPQVSPAPIPVAEGPGDGGLYTQASFVTGATGPLLIDTGTVLTSRSTPGSPGMRQRDLHVYDSPGGGLTPVPRIIFDDIRVLETPLGQVGIGGALLNLSAGGILGGDQWIISPSPSTTASRHRSRFCRERPSVPAPCRIRARLRFPSPSAGGGTLALGDAIYNYPATRVTVDACIEPVVDPASGPAAGARPASATVGHSGADIRRTARPA